MAAKKQKYYVVWKGMNPGIYDSWAACQQQIKGYPGAMYKSFTSKKEAESAYYDSYDDHVKRKKKTAALPTHFDEDLIVKNSISVDAACSGNPGKLEYRGVDTYTKTEFFHQGPFHGGTNNIGEFLALVHALAMLTKTGETDKTVYSDSRIAIGWVKKKKANTKMKRTAQNGILFELIARAESWLKNNSISNPIIKWETKQWGEIPADFGRK